MAIRVECDACQRVIKLKDEYAGRTIRCPACEAPVLIPDGDGDFESVEPPTPMRAPRASKSRPSSAKHSKTAAKPDRPWYVRQWHWFAVLAMLLLSLWPTVGLILAGLIAFVGMMIALVAGVIPIAKIFFAAPGTVLMMIVSRSARFDMMRQSDDHPYKVLVRNAGKPTRGLLWRGVLLMVAIVPAVFVHKAVSEVFRQWGRGGEVPAPAQQIPNFGPPPGRPVDDRHADPRFAGKPPGDPGQNPAGPQPGFPPRGAVGHPAAEQESETIFHVKLVYAAFKGEGAPTEGLDEGLRELPGYVPGTVTVDEAATTVRFQHRGRINPREIGPLFSRLGFGSTRFGASTHPPK